MITPIILTLGTLLLLASVFYVVVARPLIRQWGASDQEHQATWPGDQFVAQPSYVWTNAITIHAPAAQVWPWLAQLGQGRGGLYSYDWLENLIGCDVHSTRLLVRCRGSSLMARLQGPVQFVMQRKMMLGIKQRTEGNLVAAPPAVHPRPAERRSDRGRATLSASRVSAQAGREGRKEDDGAGRLWEQAWGHQGRRRAHRRPAPAQGQPAVAQPVEAVDELDGYDAFVIGSAVYGGHWTQEATEFVRSHRALLANRPVWLFSSGPIGTMATKHEPVEPNGVTAIRRALGPQDHRVFFGAWDRSRLNRSKLGFAERIIAKRLPEGDWRDWPAIDAWAVGIARALHATQPATP